jgi:hypothetical protein
VGSSDYITAPSYIYLFIRRIILYLRIASYLCKFRLTMLPSDRILGQIFLKSLHIDIPEFLSKK